MLDDAVAQGGPDRVGHGVEREARVVADDLVLERLLKVVPEDQLVGGEALEQRAVYGRLGTIRARHVDSDKARGGAWELGLGTMGIRTRYGAGRGD